MKQPVLFVHGRPTVPQGPLARYRPRQPAGAAAEYVRQMTAPGDLVLDLFCQGPTFVRETVAAGRRALGININPVSLLVAGLGLEGPPDPAALNAAFTRLADSPKGDLPLRRHLEQFYRTRCPECGAEGSAEWFAWDRDGRYPYAKLVHCPRCEEPQEGPTDEADVDQARRFEPRGLAYHYGLNRAIPADHPARERAAELVALYTPRNLAALMDVVVRLEELDLDRPLRAALHGVLLSAFDRGSSLDPHGEMRPRPRLLRPPSRFLERNIWLLLEEGLAGLLRPARHTLPVRRAPTLSALLDDLTPAYVLVPSAARDVGGLLRPHSLPLILADPTRPDGVFWALCALWAGWLWDAPLARMMRPFIRRRRFEWEWHQTALQAALAAAAPLLTPDGYLVMLFVEPDGELVESACLAGCGAGYELSGWGADPETGCRLVWQPRARERGAAPPPPEESELADLVAGLARACLEERGEPTPWPVLHTALYTGLAPVAAAHLSAFTTASRAVRRGLGRLGAELVDDEQALYWLPELDTQPPVIPLADRVEEMVRETLLSRPYWEGDEPLLTICAALDGPLTPDYSLLMLCLDSYSVVEGERWRLRAEDDPARRAEELKNLRRDLRGLGKRLGFQVGKGRGWDVRWQEDGQDVFLFVLSSTAALGRYLLRGPSIPPSARPCLVFPGGRAELLAYKLQRDPRLARVAAEGGWQFIKFRHLRRLSAEGLNRQLFETVLGLDPIVPGEGVQIPLVMGEEK